jgi:hypothetical protein
LTPPATFSVPEIKQGQELYLVYAACSNKIPDSTIMAFHGTFLIMYMYPASLVCSPTVQTIDIRTQQSRLLFLRADRSGLQRFYSWSLLLFLSHVLVRSPNRAGLIVGSAVALVALVACGVAFHIHRRRKQRLAAAGEADLNVSPYSNLH